MSENITGKNIDEDIVETDVDDDKTDARKIETESVVEFQSMPSDLKKADDLTESNSFDQSVTKPDSRHVRRIIAEDPEYNLTTVPELEIKSLARIIDNFAFNANSYSKLKPAHKKSLLAKLSLEIPLKVVTDLIEDGVYWKRKCTSRWPLCDVSHYEHSWKRLYLERNLEEIIEQFVPERTDRSCLDDTVVLSAPYVHRLIINQLLPPIKADLGSSAMHRGGAGGGGMDDTGGASDNESDIEEPPIIDHLSFAPILSRLTTLTDLRISYDVRNCGMNFEWNIFQFTVNDCLQLAKCVASVTRLKVFHLTRSRVDCDRCRVLISHLLDHPSLIELDLSHNHIGDRGARALGKLINNRSQLQVLRIVNNMIRTPGAQAIGYALLKNSTLHTLDMRLNRIVDDGGQSICKALLTNVTLREINLAANEMTEPSAAVLAVVVQKNNTLTSIDLSNNKLGPDGGKQIQEGMANNRTLLFMDMRFTDCGDEAIFSISQIISFNQKLKMYSNEKDEEIKKASPYIIADQQKAIFGNELDVAATTSATATNKTDNILLIKRKSLFKTYSEETAMSA